jgi:capsular polysaccharide biosynthesis protein
METFDAQPRGWEEGPDLLQSAWRYRLLIAAAALTGLLLGYGWAARQPTLYEGVSEVLLSSTGTPSLGDDVPSPPVGDPERYLRNQATLIGTAPVLKLAAKKSRTNASAEDLRERMSVEVDQDSDVITISVLDGNARTAATLANAVGEAYKDYIDGRPRRLATELRSRITKLETSLAQVNAEQGPGADSGTLQRRRDALVEELKQRERDLAAVEADAGSDLVQLEPGAPPEQPVQPATRRTMAVGLLLGLVASVALAWWLNARRAAQGDWTPVTSPSQPEALPDRSGDLRHDGHTREAAPQSLLLASRRPHRPLSGNGARRGGARARLMRRIARWRNTDEPSTILNSQALQRWRASHGRSDEGRSSSALSETGMETSLSSLLARLERTLAKEPLDFYLEVLPQAVAEEIPNDVPADMVAVLLDDGQGSFRVAGSVGLDADQQDAVVDQNNEALRQALWDGVSVLQDTDPLRPAATGIPAAGTVEAVVILPLVQDSTWLGTILIGRRSSNGYQATSFSDDEIASALFCGMELAPLMQSLLLAKRLRKCLAALEPSSDSDQEYAESRSPERS